MNVGKDDEEFWNSNEKNFFCFESNEVDQLLGLRIGDQEKSSNGNLSEGYLKGGDDLHGLKPLLSVISDKTLSTVLALDKLYIREEESSSVQPHITLRQMLLGQPYTLEPYKSLANKTALLDAAIASGDGNAILTVVLFLTKTLKRSLVQRLLIDRPDAIHTYIRYLSTRLQTSDITDVLTMVGQSTNSAMINLHVILKNTQDCDKLLQKLKLCYKTQFYNLVDRKETKFLQSYIQLLEWQVATRKTEGNKKIDINCSVLECLRQICENSKSSSEYPQNFSESFSEQHDVSPRQYQKVVVQVKALSEDWNAIDQLLLTKGWLGNKVYQASLPVEDTVKILHTSSAPLNILEKYLGFVDNVEKRLELAKAFNCHRIAIDSFVSQGNRTALSEYKNKLQAQSEEYFYAESALRLPSVKWQN